ncbi:3-oxoacyl-ACP reductase FabG [Pseudonocardia ailaonensis]|uniref:3-oxoacyl-ACP reductase FabG n=1 Tax=Pseudonocardia ailaonensis TaxID=367279 RepID=A0ABN2ND53_9PSEU
MSLAGRTALVTGGSRGVGRGIALRLAADGAAVAVNYRRDGDAAAEVVEEITAKGGRAVAYGAPVGDAAAVEAMLAGIASDLGTVDLLVSNAGVASRATLIGDTERSEYQRLLDVHVLGPLDLIRALLPGMRAAGRADVVVISSTTTGKTPKAGAAYTIAKTAIEAAARTLAREEREHGVRVNIVAPGLVATEMGERLVRAAGGVTIAELDAEYPFGRVTRPADVAGAVAFLVSQDAEHVTGQRIEIDGGGPDRALR